MGGYRLGRKEEVAERRWGLAAAGGLGGSMGENREHQRLFRLKNAMCFFDDNRRVEM